MSQCTHMHTPSHTHAHKAHALSSLSAAASMSSLRRFSFDERDADKSRALNDTQSPSVSFSSIPHNICTTAIS